MGLGAGQIEEVQDLVQRCRGPAVIILNAGWTPDQLSPQQRNALQAFQQVYAFVPLGFKVRTSSLPVGHSQCKVRTSNRLNLIRLAWPIFDPEERLFDSLEMGNRMHLSWPVALRFSQHHVLRPKCICKFAV